MDTSKQPVSFIAADSHPKATERTSLRMRPKLWLTEERHRWQICGSLKTLSGHRSSNTGGHSAPGPHLGELVTCACWTQIRLITSLTNWSSPFCCLQPRPHQGDTDNRTAKTVGPWWKKGDRQAKNTAGNVASPSRGRMEFSLGEVTTPYLWC